jgi:hypothetical protein
MGLHGGGPQFTAKLECLFTDSSLALDVRPDRARMEGQEGSLKRPGRAGS